MDAGTMVSEPSAFTPKLVTFRLVKSNLDRVIFFFFLPSGSKKNERQLLKLQLSLGFACSFFRVDGESKPSQVLSVDAPTFPATHCP